MHVLAGCFHFHRPCLSKFLLCAFHARWPVMVMKRGGCGLSHGHMGMKLFLYALPPYCHMPFVILQIRAGAEIVKPWFVCVVEEHATVCDVLSEFSAGTLYTGWGTTPPTRVPHCVCTGNSGENQE